MLLPSRTRPLPRALIVLKVSHKPCWPKCAVRPRLGTCSLKALAVCQPHPLETHRVALTLKSGSSQCSSCWLQAASCSGPPHMSQFQSSGSTGQTGKVRRLGCTPWLPAPLSKTRTFQPFLFLKLRLLFLRSTVEGISKAFLQRQGRPKGQRHPHPQSSAAPCRMQHNSPALLLYKTGFHVGQASLKLCTRGSFDIVIRVLPPLSVVIAGV